MAYGRSLIALGLLSLALAGCGNDGGDSIDASVILDSAITGDSGAAIDGGDDGGSEPDASPSPVCGGMTTGTCADMSLSCQCCPTGGPTQACLCTSTCMSDDDCNDSERPRCNQADASTQGICTATDFVCFWGGVCASPDTPIATPDGDRAIAELRAGDLVYSLHRGQRVAVPLLRVVRRPVRDHTVVHVALGNGRVLEISAPHPTADGRRFDELTVGGHLGNVEVVSVSTVPYAHSATYDILPASDTGTYVAAGALIASTLTPAGPAPAATAAP